MRAMRYGSILFVVFPACSLFSTSPATHGALKEHLTGADTTRIEDAARGCLEKGGYKVDPVGGIAEGANVVSAHNKVMRVDVYIHPPDVTPRVTGPEFDDPFWKCLDSDLAGAKAAAAPASSPPDDEKEEKEGKEGKEGKEDK